MCKTKNCRRPGTGICKTCSSRRHRAAHPMRYAYDTLKANCYRRHGRAWFYLTFEEFAQLAFETEYISKKGITKKGYALDRPDQTMGYFIGNIRCVPATVNNKKRRMSLTYEWVPELGRMVATLTNNYNDKIGSSECPQ